MKGVQWSHVTEVQSGNKARIHSVMDHYYWHLISLSKAFLLYFTVLVEWQTGYFDVSFDDFLQVLSSEIDCCKLLISANEVAHMPIYCVTYKPPRSMNSISIMPYLFSLVPLSIWQQDWSISNQDNWGVMSLRKEDGHKKDMTKNFRPVILLNTNSKNLAKVLSIGLALVSKSESEK